MDQATIDSAVLLTTELITNAVRHGDAQSPVELVIRLLEDGIYVVVRNSGPAFDPWGSMPHTDRWGLTLVDTLAEDWGTRREEGSGIEVWFKV